MRALQGAPLAGVQPLSTGDDFGCCISSPPRAASIIWQNTCHFQRLKIVFLKVSFHSPNMP